MGLCVGISAVKSAFWEAGPKPFGLQPSKDRSETSWVSHTEIGAETIKHFGCSSVLVAANGNPSSITRFWREHPRSAVGVAVRFRGHAVILLGPQTENRDTISAQVLVRGNPPTRSGSPNQGTNNLARLQPRRE